MSKSRQIALLILLVLMLPRGDAAVLPSSQLIDGEGVHVLIVVESSELTPDLAATLGSEAWHKLVPDDQWRVYDPHTHVERDAPKWQKAMQRERTELPWVIVSGDRGGYEGPLENEQQLITLIERYQR